MMGKVLEMLIVAGMTNHVYRFNNKIRVQIDGGPTGLSLTGEVADCFMVDQDTKFLEKLETYNLKPLLYTRFKDDILITIRKLENGTKLEEGKLKIDMKKKEEDEPKSASKITFEILKEIAEDVDPMMKFTIDTPCNYKNKKIPVLDLEVGINEKEKFRLDYEYYEKPTKHPKVILADSALSMSQKRIILTQECLRIMRNTKVELGEKDRNQHLSKFMIKVKNSGYNSKFRAEVIDSSKKAFAVMISEDKKGIKPLFRDRNWKSEERILKKQNTKRNWYKVKNSKYTSVLFVPPTPGRELIKELEQREEELNRYNDERIKFVETGGEKIETLLTKKNPFTKQKCGEIECALCRNKNDEIKMFCNTNNVGYRWTCENCRIKSINRVYEGESSRSARLRGKEHLKGYKNKNENNMLYKHKLLEHPEEEDVQFKMEITGLFKDALTRQANEATRIKNCKPGEILNSKSEFNHPPITRIVVDRKH